MQIIKVHISATISRLLESAEQMELKKVYSDGTLRELCLDDISNYRDAGSLMTFHFKLLAVLQMFFLTNRSRKLCDLFCL